MSKKAKESMEETVEKQTDEELENDLENKKDEKQEINIVKEIFSMLIYMAFVIFAIWFIITYVGQRTEVSGDSMNDTLTNGDNLWVDKLSYRFKEPERFDIVVFPYEDSVFYIKRIIGMPGEEIRIDESGIIYINEEPLEENYGKEVIAPYMIGRADTSIKLGDDEYFVMGDNRNDSKDSRFEDVGNIKRDHLEGKAVFRMWPFSKFGRIE